MTEQVRFASPDFIRWVAETMAAQPGAARRTLARHQPTEGSLCTECGKSGATWWPCTPSVIAQLAERLTAEKGGAGPPCPDARSIGSNAVEPMAATATRTRDW